MKKFLLLIISVAAISWTANSQNMALQITADNNWFEVPAFTEFSSADITFEVWVNLDESVVVDDYTAVIDGRDASMGNSKSLSFKTVGGELKVFSEWEGSWAFEPEPGANIVTTGVWQHLAVVVNSIDQTATFYINGVEGGIITVDDYPKLGAEISWNSLRIGNANKSANATVIGLIDEVRIWTVARSADEIVDNMNKEIDSATEGLLAYYKCNEESGSEVIEDELGNNKAVINAINDGSYDFVEADWPGAEVSIKNYPGTNFSVFPNPVLDKMYITMDTPVDEPVEITVYDMVGHKIISSQKCYDGISQITVDVTIIPDGFYLLSVKKSNSTTVKSFSVIR